MLADATKISGNSFGTNIEVDNFTQGNGKYTRSHSLVYAMMILVYLLVCKMKSLKWNRCVLPYSFKIAFVPTQVTLLVPT